MKQPSDTKFSGSMAPIVPAITVPADQRRWLLQASRPLLSELASRRPTGDARVDLLLAHFERHLFDAGFTVDGALLACEIRGRDLGKLFQRQLGRSPAVLVTEVRLATAAELLRSSNLKIADVARLIGYRSVQGFQRAYRRHRGETPGQTRKVSTNTRKDDADSAPISIRFSDKRYKNVAWKVAESLWDEVEKIESQERATRLLEDLNWQGEELFQVAKQRLVERRHRCLPAAVEPTQRLLDLAEISTAPEIQAQGWLQAFITAQDLGDLVYSHACLKRAEDLGARYPYIRGWCLTGHAIYEIFNNRRQRAEGFFQAAFDTFSAQRNSFEVARVQLIRASFRADMAPQSAHSVLDSAWQLAAGLDHPLLNAGLNRVSASLSLTENHRDLANQYLKEACAIPTIHSGAFLIQLEKNRLQAAEGQEEEAWYEARSVTPSRDQLGGMWLADFEIRLAHLALDQRRWQEAAVLASRAIDFSQTSGCHLLTEYGRKILRCAASRRRSHWIFL